MLDLSLKVRDFIKMIILQLQKQVRNWGLQENHAIIQNIVIINEEKI